LTLDIAEAWKSLGCVVDI